MSVSAAAPETAVIKIDDTYGQPGTSVEVYVLIEENPGVTGATLTVSYADDLVLTDAKAGDAFSSLIFSKPGVFASPCNFVWDAEAASDESTATGVVMTLVFEIASTAAVNSKLDVELSYSFGDVYNNQGDLTLDIQNGQVAVIDYTPGDLNGDARVTTRDTQLIRQLIAGGYEASWEAAGITVNTAAADVNDDGRVNSKDTQLIRQVVAGGYTDASGKPVTLKPSTPKCEHSMTATAAKAATCTEDGNSAYWYCELCKKYFRDEIGSTEINWEDTVIEASHDLTAFEAKNPSYAEEGNIAYWYCSICKKYYADAAADEEITYEETIIPKLQATEHLVEYDIANGDPYLQKLVDNGTLKNPNPSSYAEGAGLTLANPSVEGYRFLGWYDLAENGMLVKKIDATATESYQLYAYWSKIEYKVQYKSSLFVDRAEDTYTVDTGLVLPTPKLSNYSFVGWSDESGKLLKGSSIPVGTTGNFTLDANWTSERNKTWTKPVLDAPIIEVDEENGVILFAYEIGEIQNVPLYTIHDFGYIAGDGVTKTKSTTYKVTISEEMMKAYAKSVAKATTESSNWTLASTWNETTSVNEEWCQENGKNIEEVDEIAKSDTQNWNISNSKSGSTETVSTTTNQEGWKNEVKINGGSSSTDTESSTDKTTDNEAWNIDGKLTYTPKSYSFGIDVFEVGGLNAGTSGGFGGEIGGGYEHKWGEEHIDSEEHSDTKSFGIEMGGSHDKSTLTTNGTTSTASWNGTTSYGGSSTNSATHSISTALSEKISQAYGYGSSYATGGETGSSQGLSFSQSDSESYSSSVTYGTETSEEVTDEWTTQSTKPGYHRWVMAGTAHVFAVVGFDMTNNSYFVYTYSVIDDETYEFEDYSYTTADYNDEENGVISFEIPFEVAEYVQEKTSYSDGLKVDQVTGIITEYTGNDTCVVIPEYWNVGNGDVVKVTGIASNAFAGNENICAVVLSDFITEIPDCAFQNCTSLKEISGGNVTKIGSYAFAGCVNVEDIGVRSSVEHLGEKAFDGVERIIVNAADKNVLKAAVESGAEQIIVSLEYLKNGETELNGVELTVPSGTRFFELNGNYKTYENFTLDSKADVTVLNKINFTGKIKCPVKISSEEVVLNQCTITADGIALVLSADVAHLGLQSDVTVRSSNENTMLVKGLNLYEINKNVVGRLIVKNKLLQCGTTEGDSHLSYTEYQEIDLDTFDNLLNPYNLYFDANGGAVDQISKIVYIGQPYGALPVPTKPYYAFKGWYTAAEGGTLITADTKVNTDKDHTLYAHWEAVTATINFNANGGAVDPTSKVVYIGQAIGELPKATRSGYIFDGWYTALSGGSKVTASTVMGENDIVLYASWTKIVATSATIKTPATKTVYNQGDTFSAAGLTLTVKYNDGTSKTVTYTDCTITSPNMTSAGTKTVTATYEGVSVSYSVTVKALTLSLSVDTSNAASGIIKLNATASAGTVTWKSSNTAVATVDSTGKVTLKDSAGTATITATAKNGACTAVATKEITVSNTSGTKYKETSSADTSTVLYATRPEGYNTALPVTGTIPAYSVNSADITGSTKETTSGRVEVAFANSGIDGYVYYQFNYNSSDSSGKDNENKIIHWKEDWRLVQSSSQNFKFHTSFGRQFYSSDDYIEHRAENNWTPYYAIWWAYQDKQAGHTWYVALGIEGALAGSWYRFPVYNYTKTVTTYTYWYYSVK